MTSEVSVKINRGVVSYSTNPYTGDQEEYRDDHKQLILSLDNQRIQLLDTDGTFKFLTDVHQTIASINRENVLLYRYPDQEYMIDDLIYPDDIVDVAIDHHGKYVFVLVRDRNRYGLHGYTLRGNSTVEKIDFCRLRMVDLGEDEEEDRKLMAMSAMNVLVLQSEILVILGDPMARGTKTYILSFPPLPSEKIPLILHRDTELLRIIGTDSQEELLFFDVGNQIIVLERENFTQVFRNDLPKISRRDLVIKYSDSVIFYRMFSREFYRIRSVGDREYRVEENDSLDLFPGIINGTDILTDNKSIRFDRRSKTFTDDSNEYTYFRVPSPNTLNVIRSAFNLYPLLLKGKINRDYIRHMVDLLPYSRSFKNKIYEAIYRRRMDKDEIVSDKEMYQIIEEDYQRFIKNNWEQLVSDRENN